MLTYHAAATKLGNRQEKRVGNNRRLRRGAYYHIDETGTAWIVSPEDPRAMPAIDYVLHNTAVVTIVLGDFYILRTGGWMTVTTKAAINEIVPSYLCSHRGEWIVGFPTTGYVEFHEEIVLDVHGEPVEYRREVG